MALAYLAARRKDQRTGKSIMQHRHFATVAAIIKNMDKVHNQEQGFIDIREDVAYHFAAELASTNPKFDRARFIAACLTEDK